MEGKKKKKKRKPVPRKPSIQVILSMAKVMNHCLECAFSVVLLKTTQPLD